MQTGFTGWIAKGKHTTLMLLIVCYFLLITGCTLVLINDRQAADSIQGLIANKTAPLLALAGIILILSMIVIYIQFIVGSLTMFVIFKYLFKINSSFPVFFRITLILCIFVTLGSFYHIFLFHSNSNVLILICNPFFLLGGTSLYYLTRKVNDAKVSQSLLFSCFIYIVIILLINIGGV
ncbi:hypothetical protein ACFFK0_13835 [Paenibacillus chartarius]|uniref:Yip1 domain-containing protein n=1 Tax=Paenibacillus chartarius TaxID=747481 RepID=A0ABV6DLJ6_9BACL